MLPKVIPQTSSKLATRLLISLVLRQCGVGAYADSSDAVNNLQGRNF